MAHRCTESVRHCVTIATIRPGSTRYPSGQPENKGSPRDGSTGRHEPLSRHQQLRISKRCAMACSAPSTAFSPMHSREDIL
jgi:hypothetical protein